MLGIIMSLTMILGVYFNAKGLTPLSRHRLAIFYRYLAVRLQYIPGYLCYLPRPVG